MPLFKNHLPHSSQKSWDNPVFFSSVVSYSCYANSRIAGDIPLRLPRQGKWNRPIDFHCHEMLIVEICTCARPFQQTSLFFLTFHKTFNIFAMKMYFGNVQLIDAFHTRKMIQMLIMTFWPVLILAPKMLSGKTNGRKNVRNTNNDQTTQNDMYFVNDGKHCECDWMYIWQLLWNYKHSSWQSYLCVLRFKCELCCRRNNLSELHTHTRVQTRRKHDQEWKLKFMARSEKWHFFRVVHSWIFAGEKSLKCSQEWQGSRRSEYKVTFERTE